MPTSAVRPIVAIGPTMPGWGSWDWIGAGLIDGLRGLFDVRVFAPWDVPAADVVIVVKHAPPQGWVAAAADRAAVIYCPVDYYGDPAEITADAEWLRRCARVVVHARRLEPHFAPFAPTYYLDHPIKYATPTRRSYQPDGPLLWVGVRSNLTPLVAWVNEHPLLAPLNVLTNPQHPGQLPSAADLGFRVDRDVRVHEWTPERHLELTASARAALDIKGDDFRSRHKPPAKVLDLIASGVPVALNPGTGPGEHLARLGLNVPTPLDVDRWLSEEYSKEVQRLGRRLTRELAPARVTTRARRLIEAALADQPTRPVIVPAGPPTPPHPNLLAAPTVAAEARRKPRVYGLMVTRDDHTVFGDWCRDQLPLYDAVICLDGSEGDATARIAARFADRLVYLREQDVAPVQCTNHGLRRPVHEEIVRRFGLGHWVMCCHPDEFCYHDPRAVAAAAERSGSDHVAWLVPQFYPHPSEWPDWPARRHQLVPDRHRYYHWDRGGSRIPWVEDRLYRCDPGVSWDDRTHDIVRPHGLARPARFQPILRHYKVIDPDPARYAVVGGTSRPLKRWDRAPSQPGLPFPVHRPEDFFVAAVPGYGRCDRFDGTFPHSWNMGDEFRPAPASTADDPHWRRYRAASEAAVCGDTAIARAALEELDVVGTAHRVRALVRNDLAALAATEGNPTRARAGFAAALDLDPDCEPARHNLAALGGDTDLGRAIPLAAPPSRPVRVAVLSLLFNWPSTGGGNVHSAELTRFLADAGFAVKHLYARFGPWGIGRVTDPTPHPAQALDFAPTEWTAAGIVDRFRRAVDEFNPDHVVLTDSWNLKPILVAAAGGRPYVLRLQALECLCPLNNVRLLPGPDGRPVQCRRHQLATPDACARCVHELGHMSGDLHQAERTLAGVGTAEYQEALFRAFAGAEAVLAVNPLTAAMVEPYAADVRVVTAGMDPSRFPWPFPSARVPPRTPGRLRVLFAGLTREWMKGFEVLRMACAQLWEVRRDFELVATDDPPDGAAEEYVRYVGWQSQEDLPAHLAGADVVAVPTVAQEALGRTAVEAMAAGKPVVASRLGGLSFTVADGATGLLCKPGDPADLADNLARLFDDPELRARLGAAGRRRFEEEYAWPVIVRRHYLPLFGGMAVASR